MEEEKKKHVSKSITKVVRCFHPSPAGWWVQFAKEGREKERQREKGRRKKRERQRRRMGKLFSLPRFVEREPASTFAYYAEL